MSASSHNTALFLREDELLRSIALLQAANQNLSQPNTRTAQQLKIGPAQQRLLIYLALHPNQSVSTVARTFQVSKQNLWRLLSALLERNLIRTTQDPQDRRRKILTLTPHGETVLKETSKPALDLMARVCRNQEAETVDSFKQLLSELAPQGWNNPQK